MCGIAGWVGPGKPETLHQMLATLKHRGPDEIGIWTDQFAALGIARLSIIDVERGHQPVYSSNKEIIAVLNGEIYNFRELANTIRSRGGRLNSGSDAEVIPHLYEQYGDDFVHQLRGMFAIALWDSRQQRLLLARDRVGKKPLAFRRLASGLMFASEARALLATGWRPDADLNALNHVLAFGYLPEGQGAFQGLESVPPGHVATWENGRLTLQRYWSWEPQIQLEAPDVLPNLRAVLEDAVKVRMVSERPVGAFLSGGVDSSIVTSLMVRNHPQTIKTFSIGFEEKEFDEAPFAAEVARYLGTDHTALQVDPDPEVILTQLVNTYDQPLADSSAIPTMLLCELARQDVVVALSGDGGDEAFGGYERYLATPLLQRLNPLLTILAPAAGAVGRSAQKHHQRRLSRILGEIRGRDSLLDRYQAIMAMMSTRERYEIWTPEALEHMNLHGPEKQFQKFWTDSENWATLSRMRYQDLRSYLPGDLLVKTDIASMSTSLEVRSPFLDQEVLKVAASISSRQLIHRNQTKWILRELAGEMLPSALMQRRKQGFGVPVAKWLRGPLREVASDSLLSSNARSRCWFQPHQLQALLNRHMAGEDLHKPIWGLLVLELWASRWIDTPA